jgi:hypothetical protein
MPAPVNSERKAAAAGRAGIDRLFLTGWAGSLAITIGLFVALFFAFGFWWPYWRSGDMDIWIVYEAFLQNSHLPQEYFDHPGYLTILLLGWWLHLLHAAGLLAADSLPQLPPVSQIAESAAAWMRATQAARILSLILAVGFVAAFAVLLRRVVKDWRAAALAAFALAFSGGLMMEGRIVRTELIGAGLCYAGLLLLIAEAEHPTRRRVAIMGLAALLFTLALLNKVQFIFLLLTFPPVLFTFGRTDERTAGRFWRSKAGIAAAAGAAVVAVALIVWVWPIAGAGLFDPARLARREVVFGTAFPLYQTAIAVWFAGWIAAYAIVYRIATAEAAAALAAVMISACLGLSVLWLRWNAADAAIALNPFEQMLAFASGANPELVHGQAVAGQPLVRAVLSGIGLMLARQTFVFSSSARPTIFLEWAVLAMMLFAWRRGERKVALQAALLVLVSWAVDLPGTFRGLKIEYFIITDPLIIIAAALLVARVPALQTHRFAYPAGAALIVATIAVGVAEPVKHTFQHDAPFDFCVPHYPYTKRIETFSFCATERKP